MSLRVILDRREIAEALSELGEGLLSNPILASLVVTCNQEAATALRRPLL